MNRPEARQSGLRPEVPSGSSWRSVLVSGLLSVALLYLPMGLMWVYLPLLLLAWRQSGRRALYGLGLACAVAVPMSIAVSGGPGGALVTQRLIEMVMFGSVGLVLGHGLLTSGSVTRAMVRALLPWVLLVAVGLGIGLQVDRPALVEGWHQAVVVPTDEMLGELEKTGPVQEDLEENTVQFRTLLKENEIWLLYLTPAWLGLLLLFVAWANLCAVKIIEPGFARLAPLREWRPPDFWFWGLIVGAVLTLTRVTALMAIGLNLLLLLGAVYLLSGLAVVAAVAARWRIHPWVLVAILALLSLSGGLPLLVLLGIVDFWLDFRARWRHAEDQRGPHDDV